MRGGTTTSRRWPKRAVAWRWRGSTCRRATCSSSRSLPRSLAALWRASRRASCWFPTSLLAREDLADALAEWKTALAPLPASRFDSESGRQRLEALYGVKALDAFGDFGRPELAAGGALVDYVELTQKGKLPRLNPPSRLGESGLLDIDPATRRNLELTQTLTGERQGSLLATIDFTQTAAGARLLARHLAAPLTDPAAIGRRLDMVAYFIGSRARASLRDLLKGLPDIDRALTRITLGRGGPRDLAALRDALAQVPLVRGCLVAGELAAVPAGIESAAHELGAHEALVDLLIRALAPELPLDARDGGFIAALYCAELDELRRLRDDSRKLIAALQGRYAGETGVASLKIRHNNVLGYYIEVTAIHADKLTKSNGNVVAVHPSPDHGGGDALHQRRAQRARIAHQFGGRQGAGAGDRVVRVAGERGRDARGRHRAGGGGAGGPRCRVVAGGAGGRAQLLPAGGR